MQTLFVGAGYTGARVLARQPAMLALGRSQPGVGRLDLDGDAALRVALADDYAVIYAVPPAGEPDARLARLLRQLVPAPRRFVYLSTTGVYGNGGLDDETTPPAPLSQRARRRLAAERCVADWCAAGGTVAVILRVPAIYGAQRLGVERLRAAQPVIRESDAGPGNRIHVDDLAGCCIAALSADVPGGIVNVGDGEHRSSTWFANEVARQAELLPPPFVSRAVAEQTFSPRRLSFLRESRRVSTRKMRDVLGIEPVSPVAGIAISLAEEGDCRAAE